jgi:hypothetical protein
MSDKFKVEVHSFDRLTTAEAEAASDNGCGKEYATYIRVTHNGETLFLESDACEPEDKTFGRDLNWIVSALLLAYKLGRRDAGAKV